jgi:TonB-linked SusC/RagA family outer membrane protein
MYRIYTKKILLVMKITTFFLLISMMTVNAATFAQKITLNETHVPLEKVLDQIRQQSGYDIVYSDDLLSQSKLVTINLKNATLDEALKASLNDQPLTYDIEEGTVVIKQKDPSILDKIKAALNLGKIDVSGKVIGENNSALEAATVEVEGSNNAVNTDRKGQFTLKGVDPKAIIVITFIGYDKQELAAAADMGTIKLKVSENPLDEVKVIAYGETTERLNVGDVSTVTAKTIEQQPVTNVLQALENQVPGLLITQSSGMPGSQYTVQIRGQQSIANGTAPFYVIDGVPYISQDIDGGNISPGGTDPLSFINPSDIESISVLKDADATSIYGSRAANGAILITTKKGKAGKTRLDVNYRQGVEYAPQETQWMNTPQYLQMMREALANDGVTGNAQTTPGLYQFDTTRYTNWEKLFTGNAAQYKDLQTSISGGNEHTQFLFGGGYHEQSTVFPFSESVPQSDVHLNITNTSLDNRFKLSFTASYSVTASHLPQGDLTANANLPPDMPSLYNKDGSLNLVEANLGYLGNPLAFELQQANTSTNNLMSNAILSYEFIKDLKLTTTLGYTKSESNDNALNPIAAQDPSYPATASATYNTSNTNSWIITPQLTYSKHGKWGKLDALLGSTFEEDTQNELMLNGSGYTSDALITDIAVAPTLQVYALNASEYKYSALFSRLNYNFGDKYIVDLNWRRDGSSRFGADNALHDFWSAGGAWIFTKEMVFADDLPWLSFGKLRSSYGTTGNDQIGDYRYYSLYNPNGINYQGVVGIEPSGFPNATLEWEETRKLEAALELGFLKDRILLDASWYRDRSSNQLLAEPLPEFTGFGSVTVNLPATIQNTGWELTLTTLNVKAGVFSWKTNLNCTANQNKLISFPGLSTSPYAGFYFIGHPLGTESYYHYLDVNPQTGVYEFLGANGQATSNPNYSTDRTSLETPNVPKFYGGFGNTFGYKGVELYVFFQFRDQTGINPLLSTRTAPGISNSNQPVADLAAWQKPGDITSIEKYTEEGYTPAYIAYLAALTSTDAYVNASYIRLSNLQLSYQLNNNWIERFKLSSARIFLQGQNLLTITGYKNADPETQNINELPPLRVFALGLSVSL